MNKAVTVGVHRKLLSEWAGVRRGRASSVRAPACGFTACVQLNYLG